ncbi:MAG TPA: AMP-binding protein, partial [Pseudonocardiaceae bacterium]
MSHRATSIAERADADELTVLTALVAVLHRRGGQDTIRIGGTGLATIDVADDPGFAELTERIADATTAASVVPSPVTVESVDLVIADDHFELRAEPSEVDQLRDQVVAALADARERPKCPLSVLNLAGPGDLRLIAGFAGSGVAALPARCVHELVDEQAARTPDAQAVTAGWTVLTYRALVRAADRLAVRLVEAGVRADQVVGLLLPRSPELIVALLAVLKAGGAYL